MLDLIQAGTEASAETDQNGHVAPGSGDAVRAVDEIADAAGHCDTQIRHQQYAPALLALTKPALPVPDMWRPSREYRELCRQTAARISELADQNRGDVAQWATVAIAEFRKRNEAIGATVSPRSEAVQQEYANARQAIGEAAKIVQLEAEALGLKGKH